MVQYEMEISIFKNVHSRVSVNWDLYQPLYEMCAGRDDNLVTKAVAKNMLEKS